MLASLEDSEYGRAHAGELLAAAAAERAEVAGLELAQRRTTVGARPPAASDHAARTRPRAAARLKKAP